MGARTVEVSPGIYSFTTDNIYISFFVVTGEGVLASDSMNEAHSQAMLESIREVTDEPVKYLIQTHNHFDHVSGNYLFRKAGAKLVAHKEAVQYMKANPRPEFVTPDTVWWGDCKSISLGNTTFQLLYKGMNHGNGMTIVFLPRQKFVYVADLVSPNRLIFAFAPDYNLIETKRTLEELGELDWDKAVYSHTGLEDGLAVRSKQDVIEALEYMKDLRAAVKKELKTAPNPFAIPNTLKLPKYESWTLYNEFLPLNIWKIVSEEFLGPFPYRPTFTKGSYRGENTRNCPALEEYAGLRWGG